MGGGETRVVVRYRSRGSRWSGWDRNLGNQGFCVPPGRSARPVAGSAWQAGDFRSTARHSPRPTPGACAPSDPLPRHRNASGCGFGLYSDQRWLSRKTVSCDFDRAPTLLATMEPFLNSIRVGMPRTAYLAVVAAFSSTFSLAISMRPS